MYKLTLYRLTANTSKQIYVYPLLHARLRDAIDSPNFATNHNESESKMKFFYFERYLCDKFSRLTSPQSESRMRIGTAEETD